MKIKSHSESHIVELDDGPRWQIFPGDLGLTLNSNPRPSSRSLLLMTTLGSYMLIGGGGRVHVIAAGGSWPVDEVNSRPRCQEQ